MSSAGLKTIIALSFVLAVGFLLVILSCALFKEYYPLLVVGTYVLAPLPNWICGRCANPDDFVESSGNAVLDLGRFCTGFLVIMGIGTYSIIIVTSRPLSGFLGEGGGCRTVSISSALPESSGKGRRWTDDLWCDRLEKERGGLAYLVTTRGTHSQLAWMKYLLTLALLQLYPSSSRTLI